MWCHFFPEDFDLYSDCVHIEPDFEIADVRVTECGIAALGKVSRIEASDQAKVHVSRAPKMLTPL